MPTISGTVRALKEKYAGKLAPIQIPIMENGKMQGCINALQEKAYRFTADGAEEIPIPDELKAQVEEMQANLMETAAENDEVLLDKYFESGELTREETIHGIRLGIASVNTIPVMGGQRAAKPRRDQPLKRNRRIHAPGKRAHQYARHRPCGR